MPIQADAARDPAATRGRTLSLCLVFVLTSLYALPLVPLELNLYDEGVRLYGASQVLAGHLPYYDFFAYYGPAQFYWPAILFKLFGTEIVVARLGAVVFICIAAVAVFALCRHAGLSWSWAAIPIVALVVPLRAGSQLMACDPALSLVLAAGASLTGAWGDRRRTFLAGILLGLAVTFRHDFGLYGAIAGATVLLWGRREAPGEAHHRSTTVNRLVAPMRDLCGFIGGIAIVTLPAYGLLALHGPERLAEALLTEPARLMPFRTLPYAYYEVPFLHAPGRTHEGAPITLAGPGTIALFVTPLLALTLSFTLLFRRERHRLSNRFARLETLLFALVAAAGLSVYALGRSDWYHVYPLHVFSVLVASLILGSHVGSALRLLAIVVALVAVTGLVIRAALLASGHIKTTISLSIPRAKAIAVSPDLAWIDDAVRDISRFGPDGPILVAAPRHDRVHTNAVILYFLSGRPSGTYFHDMIPGLTTTHQVQEHIVKDLARNHVQTVVVWKAPLPDEPNRSRVSSGVFVLDDYLRSEFAPVRQTANYDIFVRRE